MSKEGPGAGGLFQGHKFFKRPPVTQACDGCHGGRVGREYFGRLEGSLPDVHWEKKQMGCPDCHQVAEMHGDGKIYPTRFQRNTKPSCLQCHPEAASGESKLIAHKVHGDKLSCYVCHAQSYVNCYGCHAGKGSTSEADFKIGKDPMRIDAFTTLRHVPTTKRMLEAHVPDALPNYDAVPTWTKAAPHTIRRTTKQNQACNNCHGNPDIFLLKKNLDPRYPKDNAGVAIEKPPERREP